ncbi:DUF6538 domain-containing protein [Bowmanella dokdonensis]
MTSPWKHPKTGVYYFRRAVPADIRGALGRGREIKRSLKTKSPSEAKRLIVPHIAETDDLFSLARLRSGNDDNIALTVKDAAVIAARWYERMKDEIDKRGGDVGLVSRVESPDGHVYFEEISFHLAITGSDMLDPSPSQVDKLACQLSEFIDEQLRLEALNVPRGTDQYRWLAREFSHHLFELESLCLARLNSNWSYRPAESIAHQPLSIEVAGVRSPDNPTAKTNGRLLSEVLRSYRTSEDIKSGGELSRAKTLDGYESHFKRLIEVIGDIPIDKVEPRHISHYRDTLLQLPKTKSKDVRTLSIKEQIAYGKVNGCPLLSPATVKNALKQVATVFNYALEMELIERNPAERVKKPTAKRVTEATELERGYTEDELTRIFSHPIFNDPTAHRRYGWASYWVPIICRYTGARLNEIAQLHKADVKQNDGVYYLNICRGEGRSVKSDSSVRHVPIHKHLVELGFLDFVTESKSGRLFPEIPLDKYGKASTKFSPWWGEIVREQGVNPKAPSHEFRHTVKTELRGLGVPDSVSDRITGHSAKGEGGRYGSVSLVNREEVIDRLIYLKLEKIYLP